MSTATPDNSRKGKWVVFDSHEDAVFVPADDWVGFDLDGTLASTENPGHFEPPYPIGDPIPAMLERVKQLIALGVTVKIFTARACEPENIPIVQSWTEKHGLGRLDVTHQKDYRMIRFYDDRAIQILPNTGASVRSRGTGSSAPSIANGSYRR